MALEFGSGQSIRVYRQNQGNQGKIRENQLKQGKSGALIDQGILGRLVTQLKRAV